MPRWAWILLLLAVIFAVLGFGGFVIAATAAILKILFVVFLVLFLASLVFGRRRVL